MFGILATNVKLALVSIWGKKIRSILTILGIVIGVFAITTLLGVGEGVKQTVTDEVESIGTNIVFIIPGNLTGGSGGFNPAASIGASTLTEEDLADIRKLPDVVAATPISLAAGLVKANGMESSALLVLGTTHENDEVRDAVVTAGRFIEPLDESSKAKVVVLGGSAASTLFPNGGAVGKEIIFRNVAFEVIGVLEQTTSSALGAFNGPSFDDAAYFPFPTLAEVTGSSQIFRIGAKAAAADRVDPMKAGIEAKLTENHGGEKDFTVLTQEDFLDIFNSIIGVLTAMISAIASISLLVGGIGIMNIMLVSVTERTKEIGLRKALGAGSGDIFLQFITESIVLGLAGGAGGILLSFAASRIIEAKADLTITFAASTIAFAVGFALLVGVFFGVAPAVRAARMNPIQALKYE